MARSFVDFIRLKAGDAPGTYYTVSKPERMGNLANIAYGGCVLSYVTVAAFVSIENETGKSNYSIYSLLGNYLGPTFSDIPVKLKVTVLRQTRTFATRFILATQILDDGQERSCFSATVDFVIKTPRNAPPGTSHLIHQYSAPSSKLYKKHSELPNELERLKARVDAGEIDTAILQQQQRLFGLSTSFIESRTPPESALHQNVYGIDKHQATDQDHLPITSKRAGEWLRAHSAVLDSKAVNESKLAISKAAVNAALIAFTMDGYLSFLPLSLSHRFLEDSGACSSLDCALRFHQEDLDLSQWHLREMKTNTADWARAFSESTLWDENQRIVATMSQQTILRPKKNPSKM